MQHVVMKERHRCLSYSTISRWSADVTVTPLSPAISQICPRNQIFRYYFVKTKGPSLPRSSNSILCIKVPSPYAVKSRIPDPKDP